MLRNKSDIDNLWWPENRANIRDSLIKHLTQGSGPAFLTGQKGIGKSITANYIAHRLKATIIRIEPESDTIINQKILIIDEAQRVPQEKRKEIITQNDSVLMVSVQDLTDDGWYSLIHKIEALQVDDITEYLEYKKLSNMFDAGSIQELYDASKGSTRLINLLCRTAMEKTNDIITKDMIENVAKKTFKLRY